MSGKQLSRTHDEACRSLEPDDLRRPESENVMQVLGDQQRYHSDTSLLACGSSEEGKVKKNTAASFLFLTSVMIRLLIL